MGRPALGRSRPDEAPGAGAAASAGGAPAAFGGVRVLDLTEGIAGPTATMHLADFGAEVLKVEPPGGDALAADPGYLCWNRNKRVATADPADAADRAELDRLLAAADVAVVDGPPGRLAALGLDAPSVRARRARRAGCPDLIHAWMPPYGARGAWVDLPGEAALLAALSGVADFHRATVDRPVLPVVPVLSYTQGALGAAAIAAALVSRQRDGRGRDLVVSGLHAVAAMQAAVVVDAPGISAFAMHKAGIVSIANYAPYRCRDGRWLFIGALTEGFFVTALDVLGLLEVMVLPGVEGSLANVLQPEVSAVVAARLAARFAERDCDDWLAALDAAGVPVAPVATREEWFASPTVAANDLRTEHLHSTLGTVRLPGVAIGLSATPGSVRHLPDTPWVAPVRDHWLEPPDPPGRAGAGPAGPETDPAGGDLPLRGLRVVDAASFVAGTFGPLVLGMHGATVVKVEAPAGDPYRLFSGSFAVVNQTKRGIALDLDDPAERKILDDLIATADVFVENLRPRSRARLGLDPATTLGAWPRLVHCSMAAYGEGPLRDSPGFDPLVQARSGLLHVQGGDGPPGMSSMLVHDISAGTLAAIGILAALHHRGSTGEGQHVSMSLAQASVMMQAGELTSFAGREPPLTGGLDWPGPAPTRRLYRCADGWICVWARSAPERAAAERALGSFLHPATGDRSAAPDALAAALEDAVARQPARDVLDRLGTVPAVPVLSRFEVYRDPWLADNRFFHSIPDADVGAYTAIRAVTDWPGCPAPPARSFTLDGDRDDILAELRRSAP